MSFNECEEYLGPGIATQSPPSCESLPLVSHVSKASREIFRQQRRTLLTPERRDHDR